MAINFASSNRENFYLTIRKNQKLADCSLKSGHLFCITPSLPYLYNKLYK